MSFICDFHSSHFLVLAMIILSFLLLKYGKSVSNKGFETQSYELLNIIRGNWSGNINNEKKILYFVQIKPYFFQALLNDRFVDIHLYPPKSINFLYEKYNFTFEFINVSRNSYMSQISSFYDSNNNKYIIDLYVYNRISIIIDIININKSQSTSIAFYKNIRRPLTLSDVIKSVSYIFSIMYFGSKLIRHILNGISSYSNEDCRQTSNDKPYKSS